VISLNLFFDSKIECFYNDITQIFNRDAVFQFVSWRPLDEDPHPSVIDIVVQLWRTWDGLTLAKRFINCGRADIRRFLGKFVTMSSWVKGVVFVNGFNLGCYWSYMGPQKTIFIPAPLLKRGENTVRIISQLKNCTN
jgi:hypothetical protein